MRSFALVAAFVVACGSSGSSGTHDGGGGDDVADAMIDADPNVRGTVTVRVVDKNAVPIAGMYTVFTDTDGTVTELMTDAAGMVQLDVYPNASVTAVRARGTSSYALTTVQALNPGDMITLVSASPNVSSSEDAFSQRVVPLPGADIAPSPGGATKAGATATFTTIAPHGLVTGDRVIVEGVQVAGYNGTWTVASTPSATTFTANLGAGGLANSGSGPIGATATKGAPFTISYSAYAGAGRYEVRTRCGNFDVGPSTSPALVLPVSCATGTLDFEVFARSTGGAPLAWTQKPDVAFTSGGSTSITDTWHAFEQLSATFTNPTPEVTEIELQRYSPYVRGLAAAQTMSAASGTTTVMIAASNPARAVHATHLTCPSGSSSACVSTMGGVAKQTVTEVVDGIASTYNLDVGANLLPWVKAIYDMPTTTLQVTVVGSGAYDIFEANLRYVRDISGNQVIYTWRVFGPVAQTVKFPTLPASAPGNPTIVPTDVMSNYQVFVGESDAVGGYRDAIKNPYEALGTCEATPNPNVKLYAGMKNRISRWN